MSSPARNSDRSMAGVRAGARDTGRAGKGDGDDADDAQEVAQDRGRERCPGGMCVKSLIRQDETALIKL